MDNTEKIIKDQLDIIKRQVERTLFDRQENSQLYHSDEWTEALYEYVITANIPALTQQLLDDASSSEIPGHLADSALRNAKNLTISLLVTVNYRLRHDHVLNPEYANCICDSCIRLIETQTDLNRINIAALSCLLFYAQSVQDERQEYYHPLVKSVRDYVHKNFHQKINITQMAENFGVNNSYLSQVFKKYTGKSIKQYIMEEKIERSKNLLVFSNYSIRDIAEYLGFSGSSHYSSHFSKYVGMLPREYRIAYGNSYRDWQQKKGP